MHCTSISNVHLKRSCCLCHHHHRRRRRRYWQQTRQTRLLRSSLMFYAAVLSSQNNDVRPSALVLVNLKFQTLSNSYMLFSAALYFSRIKWKCVSVKFAFVFVLVEKQKNEKLIDLKSGINKNRQLGFCRPALWSRNSHVFWSCPL
jgi:hypothetical protein